MQYALRHTAVAEMEPPEGVVFTNGEWSFDEYTHNRGVTALTADDDKAPPPGTNEEKKSILDLFKN